MARALRGQVAAGERHPRTLEAHRYQLDRHLLPAFGRRRIASLTVDDVAELLHRLRRTDRSAKTSASALATLQSVMRFARRCGWIVADPVERLEHDERPRPAQRRQRVLGLAEIERLLAACPQRGRLMLATVLYTGLRVSAMLGLHPPRRGRPPRTRHPDPHGHQPIRRLARAQGSGAGTKVLDLR